MKNNRLIFVHRFFYPDHSAGSQMLTDISFFLSKRNFEVCVVTSRTRYKKTGELLLPYENINNIKTYRTWSTNFEKKSKFFKMLNNLTLEISIFLKLIFLVKEISLYLWIHHY